MNKSELIDYVKRQLGYPTVNVELTDEQISDAIQNSLLEIEPRYTVFKYLTIDVNSSCIDLSEYDIKEITDIIKVIDVDSASKSTSDPFTYYNNGIYMRFPMSATYKYAASNMASQNIHKVISNYAQMYQEQFYTQLAMMMEKRTAGMMYENISWKYYDDHLYVDTGVPSTSVITIEYIPKLIDVDDVDDSIFLLHLQRLAVSFSQLILARVVGKYNVSNSPTTINYSDMRADAQREIDHIREEMKQVSNTFYITD